MMWYWFNFESALIGFIQSVFIWIYLYAIKKSNSVSVFVGAFPGHCLALLDGLPEQVLLIRLRIFRERLPVEK